MESSSNGSTANELIEDAGWDHRDHVFILSTSGKPVYCRHGSEDRLSTLSGVMQALVSFVQSSDDAIRRIHAGRTTIEFLVIEPVILVSVARNGTRNMELRQNLRHLYNLLLFILTSTQLQKIYQERKNIDLRRFLAGSERLIDFLIDNAPTEPGFFVSAVPCALMEASSRRNIAKVISQACEKLNQVVFGLLLINGQIICIVRMDRYRLHAADTLLILNLVASTESFKSSETWLPICLPQFDSSGYLHAYVSYLADDCPACLFLFTVDKEMFHPLQDAKRRVVDALRRPGYLEAICKIQSAPQTSCSSLNVPNLRHFLYVLTDSEVYYWPRFLPPYDARDNKTKLISTYRVVHEKLKSYNLKNIFVRKDNESIYGWSRDNVRLFLVLEPLVNVEETSEIRNKVLRWMDKRKDLLMREDFIL